MRTNTLTPDELAARLEDLREGGAIEAKDASGGLPKSLWATYSAFANTDGGTLVLGLEESEGGAFRASGLTSEQAERLVGEFWATCNNPTKVSANVLAPGDVRVGELDGSAMVVIEVPRASRLSMPVYLNGNPRTGSYRRNGSGDYRCSEEECLAMARCSTPYPVDGVVVDTVGADGLNAQTIARYRRVFETWRPGHPWLGLDDEAFLIRIRALGRSDRDGGLHPTRAGLLMFGNQGDIQGEFCHYLLDYRASSEVLGFRGSCGAGESRWDDRVVSFDGTWSGNVYDFFWKVSARVTDELPRPFELGPDMVRRDDTPMHKAVRELVANALIHADYLGRRGVTILRYPDRVETTNPGRMLVPPEVALCGGVSDTRNECLLQMFALVGACERMGSGFDAIRAACSWAGVPLPSVEESLAPDQTRVVLQTRPPRRGGGGGGAGGCGGQGPAGRGGRDAWARDRHEYWAYEARYDDMRLGCRPARRDDDAAWAEGRGMQMIPVVMSEQDQVMRLFVTTSRLTRSDVQRGLGVSETKAKRLLTSMRDEGLLEARGAGRGTYYVPAPTASA